MTNEEAIKEKIETLKVNLRQLKEDYNYIAEDDCEDCAYSGCCDECSALMDTLGEEIDEVKLEILRFKSLK